MAVIKLSDFPPGMIGVACSENARYSDFLPAIVGLQKPPDTFFKKQGGLGPAVPFNQIGQAFLEHDNPRLEWLFLTNDDNLCPPDVIPRLLRHGVDFVTGLYFGKTMPFEPILFDQVIPAPNLEPGALSDRWYRRHLMETGEKGLQPIVACGDGCLMLSRKVLETVPYPWWEYGETAAGHVDHDMVFSRKCRDAGFQLYCDTDVLVDHLAIFAVRPFRDVDGKWYVKLAQSAGREIILPAANRGPDDDVSHV
jgi:hypothetical protein